MYDELAALTMERLRALGAVSEEPGRLTRPSYTPAMRRANDMTAALMGELGMLVHEDSAGSLYGRYPAAGPNAPVLLLGSHLDSVRDAGIYDGPLGVYAGIAAVERLRRQGRQLPFAIEVAAFADEEGLRFGASLLGSQAAAGRLDPATLELRDADGVSVAEAIRAFGGDPEALAAAARRPGELLGYLEVHIEQGPLLEQRGLPLGVVTAIAGISRCALRLAGSAGHAGTTPMGLRRDALAAAAECILAAEALASETPGLVATVGQIRALPGASNVIPGAAELSLDMRHQDDQTRAHALAELRGRCASIAGQRGVGLEWSVVQQTAAVPMDPVLRGRLAAAVAAMGYEPLELPSGAGHDAAIMAGVAPAAMLFVRCRGGVSHNPAEAVEPADVALAIEALCRTIDGLAG